MLPTVTHSSEAQACAPLQLGDIVPEPTTVHVPTKPGRAQDVHSSVSHAVLQQTPSTQN